MKCYKKKNMNKTHFKENQRQTKIFKSAEVLQDKNKIIRLF